MSNTEIIKALAAINLTNPSAIKLRSYLISHIQENHYLPMIGGRLNLSVVANSIGMTRQIFYPGRGSPEITKLRNIVEQATPRKDTLNKSNGKSINMLEALASENGRLKQLLKRSRAIEELIERGIPLIL